MGHIFYKKILPFFLIIIVAVTVLLPNALVYGASCDNSFGEDVVEVSDTEYVLTREII